MKNVLSVFKLKVVMMVTVMLISATACSGCAGAKDRMEVAKKAPPAKQMVEKVNALCDIFEVYQKGVLELVTNEAVPLKEKQILRDINEGASRAAIGLNDARREWSSIDDQVAAIKAGGDAPSEKILKNFELVTLALERALLRHQDTILNYRGTLKIAGITPTKEIAYTRYEPAPVQ